MRISSWTNKSNWRVIGLACPFNLVLKTDNSGCIVGSIDSLKWNGRKGIKWSCRSLFQRLLMRKSQPGYNKKWNNTRVGSSVNQTLRWHWGCKNRGKIRDGRAELEFGGGRLHAITHIIDSVTSADLVHLL